MRAPQKINMMQTPLHSKVGSACSSLVVAAGLCICAITSSAPAEESSSKPDLTQKSLEDLMNVPISSVARHGQTVAEAAAAIYVISPEDIRRSGATSIAEALRMAPGLDVARIDGNKWAISSRGFNDFFANKLLVLMDGRSVYTPLFSGVFWDVQDTVLEDIERIEVIRGPGATLWGANAVNGVINVITKPAQETQGTLISAGGGNEERGFAEARYGGKIGQDAAFRAYVKYFNRDDSFNAQPTANDDWNMIRGGFRTDWQISSDNSLTLQGDYYEGDLGQQLYTPLGFIPYGLANAIYLIPSFAAPGAPGSPGLLLLNGRASVEGGNLLSSWKHTFSDTSDLILKVYYDRTEREDRVHHETRDTFDVDFQHRFELGERQQFIYGLGYRDSSDRLGDGRDHTGSIAFIPTHRNDQLFSGFVQDEIRLLDSVKLTLGTKLEHNDYTDFEVQPNARLLWSPSEKQSIWGAISRAVRTPARFEHTVDAWLFYPQIGVGLGKLVGNPMFVAEELTAYEIGYRVQPVHSLSFDLATFYNVYDRLRTITFGGVGPSGPYFVPSNNMDGQTYGAEVSAVYNVTSDWKLSAGYSFLKMELHSPVSPANEIPEGESPENQFNIRSYLDLPFHLQFDSAAYYVDSLPARGVPNYWRCDFRLGWRPNEKVDVSVVLQNAFDNHHYEFGPGFLVNPTEIERSLYGKITLRF